MRWLCLKFKQNGKVFYQAAPKASEILKVYKIDIWNPNEEDPEEQGYQRNPQTAHYRKVAKYLKEQGAILPTSGLLSLRREASFESIIVDDDLEAGWLNIPMDIVLFVVDSQHRIEGLKSAINDDHKEHLKSFRFPINIMEGVSKVEEIAQFLLLNTTAKKVQTDLAQRLLKMLADTDLSFQDELIKTGQRWKVHAIKIADCLNTQTGSPWYQKIRLPNSPKGSTTVSQTSFVESLKPLLNEGSFLSTLIEKNFDGVVKIIDNFWIAIRDLVPEAFEGSTDYSIQKTVGVYTLHEICTNIIEHCRTANDFSPAFMYNILKEADGILNNDFWRSGVGEAGIYTSRGGQKQLTHMIKMTLPEVQVQGINL